MKVFAFDQRNNDGWYKNWHNLGQIDVIKCNSSSDRKEAISSIFNIAVHKSVLVLIHQECCQNFFKEFITGIQHKKNIFVMFVTGGNQPLFDDNSLPHIHYSNRIVSTGNNLSDLKYLFLNLCQALEEAGEDLNKIKLSWNEWESTSLNMENWESLRARLHHDIFKPRFLSVVKSHKHHNDIIQQITNGNIDKNSKIYNIACKWKTEYAKQFEGLIKNIPFPPELSLDENKQFEIINKHLKLLEKINSFINLYIQNSLPISEAEKLTSEFIIDCESFSYLIEQLPSEIIVKKENEENSLKNDASNLVNKSKKNTKKQASKVTSHGKVLVIDDEISITDNINAFGKEEFEGIVSGLPFDFCYCDAKCEKTKKYTIEAALNAVKNESPNCILLDVMFKTEPLGIEILKALTKDFLHIPVIMMTSRGKQEIWNESMRLGAIDYIPKFPENFALAQILDRYVTKNPKYWLVGQTEKFLSAVDTAARAAEGGRTTVMITGSKGTGKEVFARYIHRHGKRSSMPFKDVQISNYSSELLPTTLFGAKAGAYTGCIKDRNGFFVEAYKGIIFLDEIGEIDTHTQKMLLRVLEEREVIPIGDTEKQKIDVQVISATNADLLTKVKNDEFRGDTSDRLRGQVIELPALRERLDDLPLLLRHIIRVEALERGKPFPSIPQHIENELMQLPWNGNIRDIVENFVKPLLDFAERDPSIEEKHFLLALEKIRKDYVSLSIPLIPGIISSLDSESKTNVLSENLGETVQNLRMKELDVVHQIFTKTYDERLNRYYYTDAGYELIKQEIYTGFTDDVNNIFTRHVCQLFNKLNSKNKEIALEKYPYLQNIVVPKKTAMYKGFKVDTIYQDPNNAENRWIGGQPGPKPKWLRDLLDAGCKWIDLEVFHT